MKSRLLLTCLTRVCKTNDKPAARPTRGSKFVALTLVRAIGFGFELSGYAISSPSMFLVTSRFAQLFGDANKLAASAPVPVLSDFSFLKWGRGWFVFVICR